MSHSSQILSLPYIQANQAQKHITHNEAIRRLDSIIQLSVRSATLQVVPTAPIKGNRYIVPVGATGLWENNIGDIALWDENAWTYLTPNVGWTAWNEEDAKHLAFDGFDWIETQQDITNLDQLGINATADNTNRLTVRSDATLLTHDGADHRLTINKQNSTDTSSLVFQTSWSGRAEMGAVGTDDFVIKTSADGIAFNTALKADHVTGKVSFPSGVEGLVSADMGSGQIVNTDYVAARGDGLFVNGTGLLGNSYNYPASFTFTAANTPSLPGACYYKGHYVGAQISEEFVPVNPHNVYRFESMLLQESIAGDWSAFANESRHKQYLGLMAFDADKIQIASHNHMRYRHGNIDSMTTLTAPLTPGDTQVQVTDLSGWNDTLTNWLVRGLIIFGYKNSFGTPYSHYSRIFGFGMFDLAGIDKTNNQITLTAPFPSSMGNPDHPNGTWPVGTRLANSASGDTYKYSGFANLVPTQSDTWYKTTNFVGGIDQSGQNRFESFSPGTAYVKVLWLPNVSNHAGGSSSFPDTGADHKILYSGVSLSRENTATAEANPDGSKTLRTMQADAQTGVVSMQAAGLNVEEL